MAQGACEYCPVGFDCMALNTVLTVIGKHKDRLRDRRLVEAYDALVARLGEDRWTYPVGVANCRLATQRDEVRRLTGSLLALWKDATSRGDELGLYEEEVCCD